LQTEVFQLIVFDINSWHYKLILYVWSVKFFLDTSAIDYKKLMALDSTKLKELSWRDYPRLEKPKTINFCPYCRAIVGSVISLPFVYLWRLFPHKPKKERTHAEIIKRSEKFNKIVRYVFGAGFAGYAAYKIIVDSDYLMGAFYIGLAAFQFKSPEVLKWIIMQTAKRLPKRKHKDKPRKQRTVSPEFFKKLQKKHEVICPPVYFIDKTPKDLT